MAKIDKPIKIRITRKERKSGQIDKSKIPAAKTKVVAMNTPEKDSPATMHFGHGSTKKKYEKQDVRTGAASYGKESKTNPTPEFVKKAQRAGVDQAEKNGKAYAAGKTTSTKSDDKHQVKISITPVMKMHKHVPSSASETGAGKDDIHQKYGKGPKRRRERVKWLEGRNKRTESGY